MKKNHYTVILFYTFTRIKNPELFKIRQKKIAARFGLKGRMLVAQEGINATFEGLSLDINRYIKKLRRQTIFKKVVFKKSVGNGKGFTKLQVKVRPEVVTLGVGALDIKNDTAPVVTAKKLEQMYQRKENFVVLDLRNEYEIQAGYFENTVHPRLKNFRELPRKIGGLADVKNKKVVAVCTGGIRCEKATAFLRQKGFDVVKIGDFSTRQYQTLIVDRSGDLRPAQAVAEALKDSASPEVVSRPEPSLHVDVSVVLGNDYHIAEKKRPW